MVALDKKNRDLTKVVPNLSWGKHEFARNLVAMLSAVVETFQMITCGFASAHIHKHVLVYGCCVIVCFVLTNTTSLRSGGEKETMRCDGTLASAAVQKKHQISPTYHASKMGGVCAAMLMLWGSEHGMSRGIRQPTADVSKVRECPLRKLGAVLGREMGADSRTQSPGELCQTWLQDTDTLSQTKQCCSNSLIHNHAHL